MADKRYNLKMTLTDGTELSAGVITAPQGPAGPAGAAGPSAYQIAVDNGFEGTEAEWLESLKGGPQGPTGPTGPQGVGVPSGGTAGQFLQKTAGGTAWADVSSAGLDIVSASGFATITGNAGAKTLSITFDGIALPAGNLIIDTQVLLTLAPDGADGSTVYQILLYEYRGAASIRAAMGHDLVSGAYLIYDCTINDSNGNLKISLSDFSSSTYPDGCSIANLPDTAVAMIDFTCIYLKA